jgi:tetratricopeptide (TPR) repeat protein
MTEICPTATKAKGGLARPQPVGVFALPAGYLLIPDGPDCDAARASLVGGTLPEAWPDELRFYADALEGDPMAAADTLRTSGDPDDMVTAVNLLVLDPSAAQLDTARWLSAGDIALATYVDTIAFVTGLSPNPPFLTDAVRSGVDGEFAAMVHLAHATQALQQNDRAAAVDHLEIAAQAARPVSKALAGQLMGQMAHAQLDEGGTQRAAISFQAALDLLADTDLRLSRAELHVAAGAMFQEMSEAAPRLMAQAINHYHQALALVTAADAPETFAVANANLGLAYLMMPMVEASDQLRIGVAVQSLREALTHFTPETHAERWSSTQLNLANALVYMPSKHQAENIAEAVELYEEVLAHRDRQSEPEGRARVLANQGNALAHLGIFDDAKAKLHEARALFEEFEDHDAVRTVRSVLDEIAKHESLIRQEQQ